MNPQKPLFSVVIPVYNKAAFIADTLTSVLNQTFDCFEVIVVNDGSTDRSLEIVNSFTDTRVKIYTKKNGGVSEARNFGIEKAQCEYIALLDADDRWEPDFLSEMKHLIESFPSCGLYASAYKKVSAKTSVVYGDSLSEGIVDDLFKVKLLHIVPCSSAVVLRKTVYEDVGGFPVGMIGGEDDYTWVKIALKYQVAFTPKSLSIHNEIGSSIAFRMGKPDTSKESWFDFYEERNFYRNEFVAKKMIYAGIRYAYGNNSRKSLEIEKLTRSTVLSKKLWWNLFLLNRMPLKVYFLLQLIIGHAKQAKSRISDFRKRIGLAFPYHSSSN